MLVIRQGFITRKDIDANPHLIYVFGDNLQRIGFGGQAKEMRGAPNSFGIVTKRHALHGKHQYYFYDNDRDAKRLVDLDFDQLEIMLKNPYYRAVVVPLDGIGTGLAKLPEFAPSLLAHINHRINALESL